MEKVAPKRGNLLLDCAGWSFNRERWEIVRKAVSTSNIPPPQRDYDRSTKSKTTKKKKKIFRIKNRTSFYIIPTIANYSQCVQNLTQTTEA